jgi:hypothetical protein
MLDYKFKASLAYTGRPCLKKKKKTQNNKDSNNSNDNKMFNEDFFI